MTEIDTNNRSTWQRARVLKAFADRDGFTDPGEALLMERLAGESRDQPILDIGIGAGRTVPYLRSLSADYVGVDYLEEMVRLTRARHPDARVELADARDLSGFADCSFGLVCFSFNGIDGLAHEDRRRVFSAVGRVLRPGGLFAYSTHNLDYPSAGRPPWDRCWLPDRLTGRALARWAVRLPARARSYRRLRALGARGDGWAILVGAAYTFGIVGHYVTLEEALRELRESGYADVEIFGTDGTRIRPGADTSGSPWFHLLARRPAGNPVSMPPPGVEPGSTA